MSAAVSGKAVTEGKTVSAIKAHGTNRKRPVKATTGGNSKGSIGGRSTTTKERVRKYKSPRTPQYLNLLPVILVYVNPLAVV